MNLHKRRFSFLTAFLPVVILILTTIGTPLYTVDSLLCDGLYARMDGTNRNIKIIAVDEETLEEYGNFHKWSREKLAELVEKLNEDETVSPALIGFDFLLTGNTDPETDARLAEVCARYGNVIAASNVVYRGTAKKQEDGSIYYDTWNIDMVEEPYEPLLGVVKSGYTNAYIAEDGCVRYIKLQEKQDEKVLSGFSWLIYETYEKKMGREAVMPERDQNGQLTFFYSGQVGEYPHFSMKSVLDGTVPAEEFKDCIVLVGAYAPGFQDSYIAAVERGNPMYGVEIQANIVQALQENKTAVPCAKWLYLLIAGSIVYAFFVMAGRQKLFPVISEAVLLMGLHLAVGKWMARKGYTIPQVYFTGIIAVGILYFIIKKYTEEKIRRKRVLSSFKKYVAPQVVDALAKEDHFNIRLGGEKRMVAVLFVDIRGFTPLSESLMPEQVVKILNEYLALTTSSILNNKGMLDKFIGDATMAVFNAPVDLEDYVYLAVCAALEMRKGAESLSDRLKEQFDRTVSFGIGVHCGEAVVGNIGCEFRMDYTAIGDTVNTAARLESKAGASEILISEAVYEAVKDRFVTEAVGEMELKGKSKGVMTYRVLDKKEEVNE